LKRADVQAIAAICEVHCQNYPMKIYHRVNGRVRGAIERGKFGNLSKSWYIAWSLRQGKTHEKHREPSSDALINRIFLSGQAFRRSGWGAHALARPERSNGENKP